MRIRIQKPCSNNVTAVLSMSLHLEARAPWGRSMTRSGVCLGFLVGAVAELVRDSQKPRAPRGAGVRGASSSLYRRVQCTVDGSVLYCTGESTIL